MRRRKQDSEMFIVWLKGMLEKYPISQAEFSRRIGYCKETTTFVLARTVSPTERYKYLAIDFFEKNYNEKEIKEEFEKIKASTFGEWLNIVMGRHGISDMEVAKVLNVKKLYIMRLRYQKYDLGIEYRIKILEYLKNKYHIDITMGNRLLHILINPYIEEMMIWLSDLMIDNNITNKEIGEAIKMSSAWVSEVRIGRIVPSKEKAEQIFSFFEERGINTRDGRKKFENICENI